MPLTPIHIRGKRLTGKRKSRPSFPPLALRHLVQSQSKRQKKSMAAVLATRSSSRRTSLETLPVELLEKILLYSNNLALAKASHRLGVSLSARATLIRLVIHAFHGTWDQWFGIILHETRANHPATSDGKFVPYEEGDPALQTAILKLPWANMDILLQAQQTWADRYGRGRWFKHGMNPDIITHDAVPTVEHDQEGGFDHFRARECFESDFRQMFTWDPLKHALILPVVRDLHPDTRIPLDVLTGPWDDDKLRRLFWFCRGGAVMNMFRDDNDGVPWENKLECLQNSVLDVSEPNVVVLNCLVYTPFFRDIPYDVVQTVVSDLDKRLTWGGDTPEGREIVRWVRGKLEDQSGLATTATRQRARRPG